jgi:hypothetical protein
MTNRLANLRPVQFAAKPPKNGQGEQTKRSKLNVFSGSRLQEFDMQLDLKEPEPQDIGPRRKATTVHYTEQEHPNPDNIYFVSDKSANARMDEERRNTSSPAAFAGTFSFHEALFRLTRGLRLGRIAETLNG